MSKPILLVGGTVLVHDQDDHPIPCEKDVVIEGDVITKIEEKVNVELYPDATVIDCKNKIISPGFIDTHHHLWQTQLTGRHGDDSLVDYMATGNLTAFFFTPEDIFWGQLGGALQALNGGTTTVADHAHMNYSGEHTNRATDATIASGIRSVFCYTPTPLVASWDHNGPALNWDILADWVIPYFSELSRKLKVHPLLSLGLAFDGYALVPPHITKSLFETARSLDCQIITTHYARNLLLGEPPSVVKTLYDLDLLSKDCVISHATDATQEDIAMLKEKGASVSCTPVLELQMGLGSPMVCKPELTGNTSLGCDSHSVVRGSMLDQMRAALSNGRGEQVRLLRAAGKFPMQMKPSVEDIFNLATIHGARALGMQNKIGRIDVGLKADIVIWGTTSPSMVCAAIHDPVAAIVTQAGTHDAECVIVGGNIRKNGGRLMATIGKSDSLDSVAQGVNQLSLTSHMGDGKEFEHAVEPTGIEWELVAEKLVKSRAEIESRIAETGYDAKEARTEFMAGFGFDATCLEV
ncbi:Metallo-dependent hydrolase [Glarea lozoyensis ATCC 20868]|uniref:Metallo-dependent hydrolase n=1 Tax=Glarea lozoyensis (strain ATCC 20868 / MF5171) TaxID=1116229 RepID=S3DG24_GLAL2|nr:Metallo-dependent hydrolase [Glarea lozoyensis ATCC 20868]EPE30951.1 Metallo-dependent hydrolase [Glarea lozoyensis ATCC 20868]